MQIPRPLYHLAVATITQFVLTIGALIVLLPTGLLRQFPWSMVAFLLAYNVAIATLVAIILTNNNEQNKPAVIRGGGLVLGHLVGVLVGGFIGLRYGGAMWAVGGATVLYFIVGWLGTKVSAAAAATLDQQAAPASPRDLQTALRLRQSSASSLFLYGAVIPSLFLAAAVFMKSTGAVTGNYASILPTARTVLVILSVVSVVMPWVDRTRHPTQNSSPAGKAFPFSLIGLGLSLAPAVYGFLLFVAFGVSFAELSLFAVVASIATTTWAVSSVRH